MGAADHDDIIYPGAVPFVLVHLVCLGALWTGVTGTALVLAAALYVVRMFGVTAGYHRYFSHRTFRTSRLGQFLLAFLAQTSAQRGVLWWAAKHRHHHRHSDTEQDVHSPRQHGFWYAHVGWIFHQRHGTTDVAAVADLARYPELRFLDRHQYLPAALLAVAVWMAAGWSGLIVGFFWSTVALYHGTFMINSLAHVHGTQRYLTGDDSRNNWWLAVLTLGEGWHNNHHCYQRSTRQGFRWYEFDPTYYVLAVLSWARVVWDLGEPPADVVRGQREPARAVLEKVARHLAAGWQPEVIAADVRAALAASPRFQALMERAEQAREAAQDLAERARARREQLAELVRQAHWPHLPSAAELRRRAERRYARHPALDAVVERARQLLADAVEQRLLDTLAPLPA